MCMCPDTFGTEVVDWQESVPSLAFVAKGQYLFLTCSRSKSVALPSVLIQATIQIRLDAIIFVQKALVNYAGTRNLSSATIQIRLDAVSRLKSDPDTSNKGRVMSCMFFDTRHFNKKMHNGILRIVI